MGELPDVAVHDSHSSLLTSNTLHEMVEAYLHSVGMQEVAADMRRETQAKRFLTGNVVMTSEQKLRAGCITLRPWAFSLPSRSLEWLLCPHAITKSIIHHLLLNGETKLTQQFRSMNLPPPNTLCLRHALHSNHRRMWSEQDDADALYVKPGRCKEGTVPNFGTLHQLIETLTHVSVLPLASSSEEKLLAQEKFTHAFLRQHRYFMSSHTVLAKLMERFIVPFSLKLGFENFETHGITVHAPGTSLSTLLPASYLSNMDRSEGEMKNGVNCFSPSATLWLCVRQKIQTRVLSVLALWLREYPHHFDEEMHHSVSCFLEDSCDVPQPWGDSFSQMVAMIEVVRAGIAVSVAAAAEAQGARGGAAKMRPCCVRDCPPTLTTYLAASVSSLNEESCMSVPEKPAPALSLCASSGFVLSMSSDGHCIEKLEKVVRLCMTTPAMQYAESLTALHLHLFVSLPAESLLQVAHCSSAAYLCSEFFRLSPLGTFLAASTDLSSWTISVLLHAAALDGRRARLALSTLLQAKNFVGVYRHFVELVIALLRLNNLHGATAVFRGLCHPIVQRVVERLCMRGWFPGGVLQNAAKLSAVFGAAGDREERRERLLEDYIDGIPDANIHALIPPLRHYIGIATRLQHEMPSFLTACMDELYPSFQLGEAAEEVVIIHWKKYMILDEMLCRITAWQANARPLLRNKAFERDFLEQTEKIVHDPWQLAQMANELFSTI